MDRDKIISIIDKIIEWSLYILVFCIPFSKTMIEACITIAFILLIFKKILTNAVNEDGVISDYIAINALFPDLSQKQKFLILYYGRWIQQANLKLQH